MMGSSYDSENSRNVLLHLRCHVTFCRSVSTAEEAGVSSQHRGSSVPPTRPAPIPPPIYHRYRSLNVVCTR